MNNAGLLPLVASLAVNLIIVAYLFGGMRTEIRNLKERLDKISGNSERLAVVESKVTEHEGNLAWGTRRFDEIFATINRSGRNRSPRNGDTP